MSIVSTPPILRGGGLRLSKIFARGGLFSFNFLRGGYHLRGVLLEKGGVPTNISKVQLGQPFNNAYCKIFACGAIFPSFSLQICKIFACGAVVFTIEPENVAYHALKTCV